MGGRGVHRRCGGGRRAAAKVEGEEGDDVVVLLMEASYSFDEAGRETYSQRLVYRDPHRRRPGELVDGRGELGALAPGAAARSGRASSPPTAPSTRSIPPP